MSQPKKAPLLTPVIPPSSSLHPSCAIQQGYALLQQSKDLLQQAHKLDQELVLLQQQHERVCQQQKEEHYQYVQKQKAFMARLTRREMHISDHQQRQEMFQLIHQELLSLIPAIVPITWSTSIVTTPTQPSTQPLTHTYPVGTMNTFGFTQCTNQYFFSKLQPPGFHSNSTEYNSFAMLYYFSTVRPPDRGAPKSRDTAYFFSTARPPDKPATNRTPPRFINLFAQ